MQLKVSDFTYYVREPISVNVMKDPVVIIRNFNQIMTYLSHYDEKLSQNELVSRNNEKRPQNNELVP